MQNHILALDIKDRIDQQNWQFLASKASSIQTLNDPLKINDGTVKNLPQINILLVSIYQKLDEQILEHLPKLRLISVLGTSVSKLPLAYCQKKEIKIQNVTGYCHHETAEWVIGQLIQFFRLQNPAKSFYGKTLALVGVGEIGLEVAKRAKALGVKIIYNATKKNDQLEALGASFLDKPALFASCDALSFHTPPDFSWLTLDLLSRLKPKPVLVNSCFGKICLNSALEKVLHERKDIRLIMDSIAAKAYPELKKLALIDEKAAFDTVDSNKRLNEKFLDNLKI